jgi:cobyrinic acid a,c-diamide synthase
VSGYSGLDSDAFLIAGTHSGAGKTTVAFALLALLAEHGVEPHAFKLGPDFIDPGFHRVATGRPSYNLDAWMMGLEGMQQCFRQHEGYLRVIEAMGGLFDGRDGTEEGSAAWTGKKLGVPVVLVVDAWGMTRSVGAVIEGFKNFDADTVISGVILNRVGSRPHYDMILSALSPDIRALVLGFVPYDAGLVVKERHLGLTTVEELTGGSELKKRILDMCRETIPIENLCAKLRLGTPAVRPANSRRRIQEPTATIGVAVDRAFCFYYQENLDLLEQAGAQLVRFSPMESDILPDVDGLYFGGGYPELFARGLSENLSMRTSVLTAAKRGMPIYGECGGMMYLGDAIRTFEGTSYPMVGILGGEFAMDPKYLAIKYVEVKTNADTLLGPAGTEARGQEFHQSRPIVAPDFGCYTVRTSAGKLFAEGLLRNNVLGSYIHLHFCSNASIPAHFVEACRCFRQKLDL